MASGAKKEKCEKRRKCYFPAFDSFLTIFSKTRFYRVVNPFPNKPLHLLAVQVFENTLGKGQIARNKQFLHFPQCFLHF